MKLSSSFRSIVPVIAFIALVPLAALAAVRDWHVDKDHSSVSFEINHFFTPVKGRFLDFGGSFKLDPDDLTNAPSFEFTVQVPSVTTDNARRDKDLKSGAFFNASESPQIRFVGDRVEKTGENAYKAIGKLTIRDVTKDFEVPFTLLGVKDEKMMGRSIPTMGIRVKADINRNDFGVGTGNWVATTIVGGTASVDILMELK